MYEERTVCRSHTALVTTQVRTLWVRLPEISSTNRQESGSEITRIGFMNYEVWSRKQVRPMRAN